MTSDQFTVGQQFRIHGLGRGDTREIYTVRRVYDDGIVYEGNKRWAGCSCVATNTALAAMKIEFLLSPLEAIAVADALLTGTPQDGSELIDFNREILK